MYPADELGNLYVEDDLPDAVTVNWAGRFTGSMSKSGSGYESGTVSLQVINDKWTLKDTSTDPESVRVVGRCLITGDGNLAQGDDLVEDQFEDTYTLTSIYGSVEVSRVSLCRWESPPVEVGSLDLGGTLEYYPINLIEGQPSPAWIAAMNDGQAMSPAGGEKTSPNLSSPVGTYDETLGAIITVS